MHEAWLELELLEDTVISKTGATAGAHRSLDYIPGANLMGVAASVLYDPDAESTWSVFHADGVVFGDAMPLTRTGVALPIPLSWHERKAEPAASMATGISNARVLQPSRVHNLAVSEPAAGEQVRQLRNAWVDMQTGELLQPTLRMRMKTALEPGSGTVASGQLFGYEALPAGMRFAVRIASEREDWLEWVTDALCGEIFLGRSRSAEYGATRVTRRDAPPLPACRPGSSPGATRIYLLSDLCLSNEYGQPAAWPEPKTMGIEGCRLDAGSTYLRTRSYSPWNAYRRSPELERQVIVRGSVIVLSGAPNDDWLQDAQTRGLGLHTGQGLGQVLIDPDFLETAQPMFPEAIENTEPGPAQRPASPLLDLLTARARQRAGGSVLRQSADRFVRRLFDELELARRAAGLTASDRFGPSASQWRKLQQARSRTGMDEVLRWAFDSENGVARKSHAGWCDPVWTESGERPFVDWFRQRLEEYAGQDRVLEESFGVFVGYVADLAARETRS